MAKMFYTLEEAKSALGRNEEGIKQLSREGRLREFRDGPRLMFKADQVEAIKADLAGGGTEISLAPGDSAGSGAALAVAGDTRTGSGLDELTLASMGSAGGIPSPGKIGPGSGMLNLSGGSAAGSLGGPGGSLGGGSGSGLLNLGGSNAGQGTRGGGITIFDADDAQRVDPSAQTAINAGGEQLSMETGSGSGLLDLTRESDDTSLGAVFDDLGPGKAGASGMGRASSALDIPAASTGPAVIETRSRAAAPIYMAAPDPLGAALGVAAVVPIACLGFACFVIGTAIMGYRPAILDQLRLASETASVDAVSNTLVAGKLLYFAIGALAATIILFFAGFFVANAARK